MTKQTLTKEFDFPLNTLVESLGTFWSIYNPSKTIHSDLLESLLDYFDYLLESVDAFKKSVGIKTISDSYIYTKRPLLLSQGEYNQQTGKRVYDIDSNILSIDKLANSYKLENASVVITSDNFEVNNGKLIISTDFFEHEGFLKRDFDGSIKAIVWAFNVEIQNLSVYYNFGPLLSLGYSFGDNFELLVKALWNLYNNENIARSLFVLKAIQFGIPVSQYEEETVQSIDHIGEENIIVTDKDTYKFSNQFEVGVTVNQKLKWGTSLAADCYISDFHNRRLDESVSKIWVPIGVLGIFDSISFLECEDGSVLTAENGDNFVLENHGQWNGCEEVVWSSVVKFPNELRPVTQISDGNKIRVRFEVEGEDSDIEQFWSLVAKKEDKTGHTLYEYLVELYGEAPNQLNPAQFMVNHVLSGVSYMIVFPGWVFTRGTLEEDYSKFFCPGSLIVFGEVS